MIINKNIFPYDSHTIKREMIFYFDKNTGFQTFLLKDLPRRIKTKENNDCF